MPPARQPATPRRPRPRPRSGSPPPTGADRRPSRQQRRQAARAEHAARHAKRQRRRRRRRIALPLASVVLVAIATLFALAALYRPAATRPAGGTASQLPGLQTGPAPWTANPGGLAARLRATGLPPVSQMEASDLHTHQHLDLSVDGHRVQVPALVGIDPAVGLAPLHTHDASGVIHVESPVVRTYTLGQFFAVWGVRFSPTCLGGYCTNPTRQLRIYVNGQPYQADPTRLALAPTRRSWSPTAPTPSSPTRSPPPTGSHLGSESDAPTDRGRRRAATQPSPTRPDPARRPATTGAGQNQADRVEAKVMTEIIST